ncbi:MAG: hypothetical protein MUE50_05475 [Pirellulaceae bacterium]|jgi:hypothetical protein|nr:hypothetical protein [Pirellulaceae bacterium]
MTRKSTLIALAIVAAFLAIAANYRIDIGKVWKSLEIQPGATIINRDGNDIAAQLDALDTIVVADLEKIDGITNGTAAANKALVLGASKEISTITTATITTGNIATVNATNIDAGASGTAGTMDVFPSTASRGKIAITAADSAGDTITTIVNASQAGARTYTIPDAGASASFVMTAGAQTIAGAKTFGSALVTTAGVGAAAGTGVAATSELGDGIRHQTVLTFTDVAVALTDEAGVIAYGGLKIYDLPVGAIVVDAAVSNLDLTKSSAGVNADWDGDFSLGTTTAGNDADLTTTEVDILAKTATPQAVAGVTTANGGAATNAYLNGTTTAGAAKDVYVNFLVDDADHNVTGTACNLILNGTVTLTWINAGDY